MRPYVTSVRFVKALFKRPYVTSVRFVKALFKRYECAMKATRVRGLKSLVLLVHAVLSY